MKHSYDVIFFTGAGISAESGIPTFEEQPGIRDVLTRERVNENPDEYVATIKKLKTMCEEAKPNDAHKAIAETGFPVITMNIDGLHKRAGSENVLEIHGRLPTDEEMADEEFALNYNQIVLYGDVAPNYVPALNMVKRLKYGTSTFVIVGTSFFTLIADCLLVEAKSRKAKIIIINQNAATEVPELCKKLKEKYTF